MNTAKLKSYAPQARRDFIAAVQARANQLGLSAKGGKLDIAPSEQKGDIVVIAGQAWPAKVHQQRERLIARITEDGFAHTIEAVAYTWFNRFAALRYMEIHDYLEHGYRALSSREGGLPEILAHATELVGVLPGLNAARIADLKLAGNKDGELYRLLLVAQCNALSRAMPFLFERIDDESELLLPDNLIRTDSLIASLVDEIPEGDWANIEIIGWLYQFYISEKKDQVIGKVVASEDIPAATQLFTPNWIVKYMVQNSLGAQWLATYPDSALAGQMAYYIEPAEQTDEVKAQLAAITPSQLNPEELTLIDPASGSGHILVEAYELFKAIYLERGYRQRDVAQLILEKNLFGLDIDERAAQLTGFALMMKGRADDRRLFERGVKLNVMALVDSAGFDAERLAKGAELGGYGLKPGDLTELKRLFEHATTFGSLIQVPEGLAEKLPALRQLSDVTSHDMFVSDALKRLAPLVQQADLLAAQYDAVVANPPYMGNRAMPRQLSVYVNTQYPSTKADLYAAFLERAMLVARQSGHVALITMHGWMFISSFESAREALLRSNTLACLAHLGARAFSEISGEVVQTAISCWKPGHLHGFLPTFIDLTAGGEADKRDALIEKRAACFYTNIGSEDFSRIPGSPLAYSLPGKAFELFSGKTIGDVSYSEGAVKTGDNERFLRRIWEVDRQQVGVGEAWRLHPKGGGFRKWSGNVEWVVNWSESARRHYREDHVARTLPESCWDLKGICWSEVSTGRPSFRELDEDEIANNTALSLFPQSHSELNLILAVLNSGLSAKLLSVLSPTFHFLVGDVQRLPMPLEARSGEHAVDQLVAEAISISRDDWNYSETAHYFFGPPLCSQPAGNLEEAWVTWCVACEQRRNRLASLETALNETVLAACGLADELTPDVPLSQITLTVNPAYRYGGKLSEEEQWTRFRQDTMEELLSYAVGCMMGRYSLDEPGLIYAHAGNVGFDATRYRTFPADADGIVPVTDELWFQDDAANRVREFLLATWGAEKLDQNMAFLADNLGAKASEAPGEAIRRYLADKFFKDHCSTYKKRPIYWLFSSGKQGGFQALVYLHRYHEGTLARMRAEYVVPLTGKMLSRIEMLEKDRDAASSTAARNRIAKQIESLKKKHVELLAYDEKLRHYADRRITLDLDDGVKVNYGKFGDLLAEVKAVTGGANDE
jgi:type II restriction/modification system DNA methylase subunit YeeA